MRSASGACAQVLVDQLVAQGITEFVLCPGSRSAPLALALFAADAAGELRLHVRVDERSAGFLALGLAKATGVPAAVVTTSGTAVGNLLPAVLEADHAGVGLVVLSADRPAALVGFGANQTTDQVGIFGGHLRYAARVSSTAAPQVWAAQAAKAAVRAGSGPVQLNVELGLPLVPDPEAPRIPVIPLQVEPAPAPAAVVLQAGPRTVIVAGDAPPAVGQQAHRLAVAASLPLIAEPSSNARCTDQLPCGRLVLGTALAEEIERVLVFGHPTLSRPVSTLLARADVEVIAVGSGEWPDPGHRVRRVVPAVTIPAADPGWLGRWRAADAAAAARVQAVAESGLNGWALAAAVWSTAPGPLVLGSSQLIRDADLVPAGPAPVVYANRGLAGIDGTVATATGIALATGQPTTLLCGDLTFLHDANALACGPEEPRPELRIVVGDDRGGAIFATLEYGEPRFAGAFERVFATPVQADLAVLAAAYGVATTIVTTRAELDAALAGPIAGVEVVVVRLDRTDRRVLDATLWS